MRVVMVGTGYVGLVSGTCLAEIGHDVICMDIDERKINMLRNGESPIFEPGLEAYIHRNIQHDRLHFTHNLGEALQDAEIVFIAVGTPEGEDGSADLGYVVEVARSIGKWANRKMLAVVKSTVPVGTCDMVDEIINRELTQRGMAFRISVSSNPEFLKEGDAINDFMRPDRVVIGIADEADREVFRALYGAFVLDDPGRLLFMDRHSSELTKYGANAMLATRISFMNEMARLCERLGANIDNIRIGMGADPRIGKKFLYAGPGYGGSCFPKDVAALLMTGKKHGMELRVLQAVSQVNDEQKQWASQKVKHHFGSLTGKRVGVWGLTFKPGTDDVRDSPAKVIIANLLEWGAEVLAHDPQGLSCFARQFPAGGRLTYCEKDAYDALAGVDALVLVTEWSEYKRPNWTKVRKLMRGNAVFDLRNQYDHHVLQEMGFKYYCIGRSQDSV